MRHVQGIHWETIPEEWSVTAFFSRIVVAELCSYEKLLDGSIDLRGVFAMHKMLDFAEYSRAKAVERAQNTPKAIPFEQYYAQVKGGKTCRF